MVRLGLFFKGEPWWLADYGLVDGGIGSRYPVTEFLISSILTCRDPPGFMSGECISKVASSGCTLIVPEV